MNYRPTVRRGDIVKLSKKGKTYPRTFDVNSPMVVIAVQGDGQDRSSVINCRIKTSNGYEIKTFYRSELWYTGSSAF